jgi:formylglycine-generating enzyme required for sulfatase activity/uncharacterized protein YgiM (DUF1202 family)
MVVRRFLVLAILMITLAAFPVQAAKRVALVIGNNAYATLPNLNNAKKDAEGMAAKLRGLGFDVILKTNAGRREMGRTLADFENRISNADVALVFYAGHGIQASGTNHLIPSDARIEIEEDLRYESIDAQDFLKAMKRAGTSLNIVVLDACRDNPLPRRTRSAARGLAIPAPPAGIKGTAIIYSAAPGQTAQDGPRGGHGVFTGALLAVLDKPDLKLEDVFKETATRVAALTNGKQDPWINSSVKGNFYFKQTGGAPAKVASINPRPRPATPPAASSTPRITVDELDENKIADRNANVRSGPSSSATKLSTIRARTSVQVTGRVQGRNWYQVLLSDGRTGYVFAPLLRNAPDTRIASKGPATVKVAPTVSDPSQVMLPDGLRLSDWILIAEDRLKAGEYRSLVVEGMAHRRKYGQFASLNKIIDKSVTALLKRLTVEKLADADDAFRLIKNIEGVVGKSNSAVAKAKNKVFAFFVQGVNVRGIESAKAALTKIALLKARFGDNPAIAEAKNKVSASLLEGANVWNDENAKKTLDTVAFLKTRFGDSLSATYLEAKAHHRLDQFEVAEKGYRHWLAKAKPDAKGRKEVLALLFRAQKHKTVGFDAGAAIKDCSNCPEMIVIPPGSFQMGSPTSERGRSADEGPQHQVTISKPFAVGKFEVTFAEWDACVSAYECPRTPPDMGWGRGRQPAINVSWDEAQEYIRWVNQTTGKNYRLLSEAEWEYISRSRVSTPNYINSQITGSRSHSGNRTKKVGSYQANSFGVYDLSGNVIEWVEDCWNDNYQDAPVDGSAWTKGQCRFRVLRGGSLHNSYEDMRIAKRRWDAASKRSAYIGFRVARDLE